MADEQNTEVQQDQAPSEKQQVEQNSQPTEKTYTHAELEKIMGHRLGRERDKIFKDIGTDDVEAIKSMIQERETLKIEEKKKRGEYEDILKEQATKYQSEINGLKSQIRNIKVNDAILQSASKNKAINPQQVVDLLKSNVQLNDEGQVEVLAENGTPRYNKDGNLYSVEEYVSEFLTQNPHFQLATPSGTGSQTNVARADVKPFNLADLDLSKPEDKKRYEEYRNSRQGFALRGRLING